MAERQRAILVRLGIAAGLVIACAGDERVQREQLDLVGVDWQLVAIETEGGSMSADTNGTIPTVLFRDESADEEGARRLGGSGGCNRFFGSYETRSEGGLSISPLGATKMMCADPEVMELESAFFESLSNANSYSIESGELTIRFAGGLVRFRRGAPLQQEPGG